MLSKAQQYTLLGLISLIWGSQFIFTVSVLAEYTPPQIAVLRTFIGAAALSIIMWYLKEASHCDKSTWIKLAFISLFEAVLPFMLIAYGLQTVTTGTAAILMGTIPVFTLIFDAVINKKSINKTQLLGLVLGFIALLILFWQDLNLNSLLADRSGEFAILLAAISFAFSLILISKLPPLAPITAARNILLIAGFLLLLLVIFLGELPHIYFSIDSIGVNCSLLFLGVFCSGFVYVLFVKLIQTAGPTFAALTNYLVPIIAVIIGMLFAAEVLSLKLFVVLALMICALALIENRWPGKAK
ncbi:MAG: DMT family transporter [Gammaproteobacteria bacterium]